MVRRSLGVEDVVLPAHGRRRRLVETGDRHRLQRQPVGTKILLDDALHLRGELVPLGVQLVQGAGGGHGAQRRDQLLIDQELDALGVDRALAERGGGVDDVFLDLLHLDVELGRHVSAQVVARDERVRSGAVDVEAHGQQRDRDDLMHDRDDQRAAIDDRLLAAHAGADEGLVGGRFHVQPGDGDDRGANQQQDQAKSDEHRLGDAAEGDDPHAGEQHRQDDEDQGDDDCGDAEPGHPATLLCHIETSLFRALPFGNCAALGTT